MGGRGTKSGMPTAAATTTPVQPVTGAGPMATPPQQQQAPPPAPQPQANRAANQAPNANNTPVTPNAVTQLTQMSDAQLAQLYRDSQGANLPNHLGDVDDKTQKFVFQAGINGKPMVLDQVAFNQFLQDNNIPRSQILARSFNPGQLQTSAGNSTNLTPQDIADMLKYSRLNYIGGKIGGQAYGAGTYLDMNGGSSTGYGGVTVNAVLNPATARVISDKRLKKLAQQFDRTYPQFAKATGGYDDSFRNNNMSIYALALGYNVINEGLENSGYHNVIDRTALVYLQ